MQAAYAHAPDNASGPPERRSLVLRPANHPARGEFEQFIGGIYARRFGAHVRSFAPTLVGLRNHDALVAAAGYRGAGSGRLYLERYLAEPVEAAVSKLAQAHVHRAAVVEVGHLAASRWGEGLTLVRLLASHLVAEGFEWAVGTVTRELRPALERLDARLLTLDKAEPSKLGDEAERWGSYYEHDPVVVAVDLRGALLRHAQRGRKRPGSSR